MAAKTSWKGYLKLSLVSCAVALAPAQTDQEKVRFNTLNKNPGNRLKQQLLDAETGEVVEREDVARGYEHAKGFAQEAGTASPGGLLPRAFLVDASL